MDKFSELKIRTSLFSNFYSEFIQLVFDLKYNSKIFIEEFNYKLILCL